MNLPTVVNRHKESFDIYIGRGTKWGNKYHVGKDGTRKEVMQKHFKRLIRQVRRGS